VKKIAFLVDKPKSSLYIEIKVWNWFETELE